MAKTFSLLPRSLVGRVYALYTVTLLAFVAAGLGLFYRHQFTVEMDEAQERAATLSAVIVPSVTDSAVIGDYDTIRRTLEQAVYHSSFASASFIDIRGGAVSAKQAERPRTQPPAWLANLVAARLYDTNQTIAVGGRDYGVLRLSFATERIAGLLWEQVRIALLMAVASLVGGLVLIRFPLVHWLGKLGRLQAFEEAMHGGHAAPSMLAAEEAPTEFQETFAVLGRAAERLQSHRVQATVTLGAIADGVFTLDPTGRVLLANPAACAMTGRDAEAAAGQPIGQLLPGLVFGEEGLVAWSGRRTTLHQAERGEVVVDTTLSPILAPDGNTSGYVLACRDVSEQHRLDQRLRAELEAREQALVALRRVLEGLTPDLPAPATGPDDLAAISSMISGLVHRLQMRGEQLDAIFALSPDGFVSFDARRRVNYVSPAFTRLTGIAAERVLGAPEGQVESLLRAQGDDTRGWCGFEAMRRASTATSTRGRPPRELIELVRPADRVLEARLRQGTTEAISQVLSLRDVTHETVVDRMKSEFLSTAAHELRTPMASIYGFAELMARRRMTTDQQHEIAETIHRQSELMITILNELLDLARIESRSGRDFEIETLDLSELAAQVLRDFKPPQDRALPVLDGDEAPATVRADRNKLRQALGNVLSNAFKYSPDGQPVSVTVVHRDGPDGAAIGVQVRDRGIGMTPAQLSRVCERFYRADASGNIPGTGLGMSIVKEIVELLDGQLAIDSTAGVGTTVTLWLPAVPEAVVPRHPRADAHRHLPEGIPNTLELT
ncbi:ATP-binding protein [Ideonella sp. A 288]|uniref:PAS domain-containing sensor histidine kinase n=1 Tax=Ideonella sp. A 288 TaxID=1962181 RepID=UPI000B4B6EF4|nr:ATP-binding protein [Ideonella sp. A 288]